MPSNNTPVWVLNLDRSRDRRNHMLKHLESLGLSFEFFPAVDGRAIEKIDRRKYSPVKTVLHHGRFLTDAELGCSLSHLAMYEKLIRSDFDRVLILEDDVTLSRGILEFLARGAKLENHPYDVINLLSDADYEFVEGLIPGLPGYRVCKFLHEANRTSAYIVTREAASKLVSAGYPIFNAADGLLGRTQITGIKMFGVYPPLAMTGVFESEIGLDRSNLDRVGEVTSHLYFYVRYILFYVRRKIFKKIFVFLGLIYKRGLRRLQ